MSAVAEQTTTKKGAGTKLTLQLPALQKALATITPAIERKTTIPVLSAVRVEQTEEHLEFTGTNLDLAIRVRVAVRDAQPATAFLLPALKLDAFARLLQGDQVTIKVIGDDERKAELRCGRSVTRLPLQSLASYPAVTMGTGEGGIELTQADAERMLRFTTFAISEEESRYVINGGLFEVNDGRLSIVATDGHRLARYSVPTDEHASSQLLPAAFLRAVQKTIDGGNPARLSISMSDDAVFANVGDKTGEVALSHRKLTGQFPNYRAVMPQKMAACLRVNAEAVTAALKRCVAFADERSYAVKLTVDRSELRLRGANTETGETDETVDVIALSADDDFAPFDIGFSGKYLLDGFSRLTGEVQMRFSALNGQNSMMLFAEPSTGETFEYVVMPMRV